MALDEKRSKATSEDLREMRRETLPRIGMRYGQGGRLPTKPRDGVPIDAPLFRVDVSIPFRSAAPIEARLGYRYRNRGIGSTRWETDSIVDRQRSEIVDPHDQVAHFKFDLSKVLGEIEVLGVQWHDSLYGAVHHQLGLNGAPASHMVNGIETNPASLFGISSHGPSLAQEL